MGFFVFMAKGEFENQIALILSILGLFVFPFILIPLALLIGHKAKEVSKGKFDTGFNLAKTIMWIYVAIIIFLFVFALIFL